MQNLNVTILMSTYNGRRYLREQLDSILDQSYAGNIRILIRDDGSRDDTKEMIRRTAAPRNREIVLIEGNNIGPQKSFLELIRRSEGADYYFFADQDDVWDPDKIENAVRMMETVKGPCVYCSNYRLSDGELNLLDEGYLRKPPVFTPLRIIFYNEIPGCTMGMNEDLMKQVRELDLSSVMMHDSMVLSYGAFCGQVLYDPISRITHRIHGSNVVGEGHAPIVPHKWIVEKIRLLFLKDDYDLSEMADRFLTIAKDSAHEKYIPDLVLLRDFKKSWFYTFRLLRHPDSKSTFFDRTTLSIRCKILFHVF